MFTSDRAAEVAHAREVDTRIAAAWSTYYSAVDGAKALRAEARRTRKYINYYYADTRARLLAKADEKEARAAVIEAEAAPLKDAAIALDRAEYEGWSRFYLVEHIHSNAHCSSFRPTTRVGWLPDVSGLTEAEAVAEHGATLCTICFPSAPTELTTKAADPDACPGSGKYIPYDQTIRSRGKYAECPECHEIIYRTPGSGNLRKHKTKGA